MSEANKQARASSGNLPPREPPVPQPHNTHKHYNTTLHILQHYQLISNSLFSSGSPPSLSFKFQFNSRNYFSKDLEYRITSNPIWWGKQEARLPKWLIYWVIKLYDDFIQLKSPVWKWIGKHNQFRVAPPWCFQIIQVHRCTLSIIQLIWKLEHWTSVSSGFMRALMWGIMTSLSTLTRG